MTTMIGRAAGTEVAVTGTARAPMMTEIIGMMGPVALTTGWSEVRLAREKGMVAVAVTGTHVACMLKGAMEETARG